MHSSVIRFLPQYGVMPIRASLRYTSLIGFSGQLNALAALRLPDYAFLRGVCGTWRGLCTNRVTNTYHCSFPDVRGRPRFPTVRPLRM